MQAYNTRYGNNRAAATVAVLVGRLLYKDGNSYWETTVHTTPADIGAVSPADIGSYSIAASKVTGVDVILATESATAVRNLQAGGHDHERQVITSLAAYLQEVFPRAKTITVEVLFGESHLHSKATYAAGALDYTVVDGL